MSEIVDSIMPYISHESEAYMNATCLRSFSFYYNPSMATVSRWNSNTCWAARRKSVVHDRRMLYDWLMRVGDYGSIGGTSSRNVPWHFKLFPEQDIALFEFNTCGPYDKLQ